MKETHIAQMLHKRASKYKSKEALRFYKDGEYQKTSWQEFSLQAKQVAAHLLSIGVQVQDNVGIFSQNCPQWTIADLAVLSVRGVVVPVFPTSPIDQLKYILDETEAKVLFVDQKEHLTIAKQLLNSDESTVNHIITFNCEDDEDERIIAFNKIIANSNYIENHEAINKLMAEGETKDLATIIYTSGTTGEPKGAMLDHHNFMSSFNIHSERLSLNEEDVSMCFLPLSHVFERTWTYFVLYSGACNVYNYYPKKIMEELPKVKPTVMCTVPRLFEKTYEGIMETAEKWPTAQQKIFNWALNTGYKYVDYKKDSKTPPFALSLKHKLANKLVLQKVQKVFGGNIKYIPCAGAAMSGKLVRFFHALGIFVNYGYGATETLATVSCMRDDQYDFDYTGSIMPTVDVKINEENMILVKGDTVFKGYYKKPEETAKTLIDGWYYTGDQGSIPKPGTLHMTERIKDIIKTSTGKYVSPQKVENLLMESEYIEQLCVIGDNRKYLTALIVPPFPKLQKLAEKYEIELSSDKNLNANSQLIEAFGKHLEHMQKNLAPFEKVVKFTFLQEPFSIENTLLTNSLKVRRKAVNKQYADEIAKMY